MGQQTKWPTHINSESVSIAIASVVALNEMIMFALNIDIILFLQHTA